MWLVTSREGRVSRNDIPSGVSAKVYVTSREGRVSRNANYDGYFSDYDCHVPRGTCE